MTEEKQKQYDEFRASIVAGIGEGLAEAKKEMRDELGKVVRRTAAEQNDREIAAQIMLDQEAILDDIFKAIWGSPVA